MCECVCALTRRGVQAGELRPGVVRKSGRSAPPVEPQRKTEPAVALTETSGHA